MVLHAHRLLAVLVKPNPSFFYGPLNTVMENPTLIGMMSVGAMVFTIPSLFKLFGRRYLDLLLI